jgi:hypothetical protein
VQVSRSSPFVGCAVGATPDSVVYPNAEVEPSVATNRFLPFEVVGAWQQDRWNDGGARGSGRRLLPRRRPHVPAVGLAGLPVRAGGLNYERASDPRVSICPKGTVYGSALPFDVNTPRNTVAALTSDDGGRTWRNVTVLIDDTQSRFADDKNSVTADRSGSARLPGLGPAGVQPRPDGVRRRPDVHVHHP